MGYDVLDGNLILHDTDLQKKFAKEITWALNTYNLPKYLGKRRLTLTSKNKSPFPNIEIKSPKVAHYQATKIIEKAITNKIRQIKSNH